MYTLLAKTTTTSSVCPKCGIVAKSGKSSCCGHGGFWFGHCGSAGNAKPDHTWYEGIQACETLMHSKAIIDRQPNAAQQRNSSNGSGVANSKEIITPANTFTFASSAPILVREPSIVSVIASIKKSAHMSTLSTSTNVLTIALAHMDSTAVITTTTPSSSTTAGTASNTNTIITTSVTVMLIMFVHITGSLFDYDCNSVFNQS